MYIEKDFFTKRRLEQLAVWPDLRSIEELGKYCYIPLDIPKIESPQLVKWFFEECKPTYRLQPDIASPSKGGTNFDTIDILPTGESVDKHTDAWSLNLRNDFLDLFPDVFDQIMEYFPFKKLTRLRMWSSNKKVTYHRDHTIFVDYPSSFRIMLFDENPIQTLKIYPSLPGESIESNHKFILPRFENTNSFVWNNLRVKHGSNFDPIYRKILFILDRYELDIDRYKQLIKQSLDKYQNHSLVDVNPLSSYIHI
jgi:hypothetical protein